MTQAAFSILVLRTGNAARSVVGEAIFDQRAPGRIQAFSADSKPKGEACPVFPGTPLRAHWGLADPADVTGEAAEDAAFAATWRYSTMRTEVFPALPFETMDRRGPTRALAESGQMGGAA